MSPSSHRFGAGQGEQDPSQNLICIPKTGKQFSKWFIIKSEKEGDRSSEQSTVKKKKKASMRQISYEKALSALIA